MPVYFSAMGIACSIGQGKQEVAKTLFHDVSGHMLSERALLSGKSVPVGKIPFDLPELPPELMSLNSRNNRLLKVALDEIKPDIEDAIAKYGVSRVGVVMATSTSGMLEEEQAFRHKHLTGYPPKEFDYSQSEISSPSQFASQYLGIYGPAYTVSSACTSASKAIYSARRLISTGICDAVVVGGVDTLCDLTLNGFDALELMSMHMCNPFSQNRDGITIGEGVAVFLATCEGALGDIELAGCGESSDAHHMCAPEPEGVGAQKAICDALAMAGLQPENICYINLHGTGTPLNDSIESAFTHRMFGDKLPCSSTKALTGHTLGASGAIAAAFLWLALSSEKDGKIPLPPHVWDGQVDPSLPPLHFSKPGEFVVSINGSFALMSNAFAFGGSNTSIILKRQALLDVNIKDLLPHDPPMVLIDRAMRYNDDSIHCQLTIKDDSPFCEGGFVPSYVALEYMAQTIAAWNGLISRQLGEEPKIGYLLGARQLVLNVSTFQVGEMLDIYGKSQYVDGEMASFDCWIDINGKRVAHAGLNVFQPKEKDGK